MERIRKNQRHIRWNWERSPDNSHDENPMVRYHFIIVDDKNRDGTLRDIIEQLDKVRGGVIEVRSKEGHVSNSDLRYLFLTFDSSVSPEIIDWRKIVKPVKRDKNLYERKRSSLGIEDYVQRKYS